MIIIAIALFSIVYVAVNIVVLINGFTEGLKENPIPYLIILGVIVFLIYTIIDFFR